MSNQQYQFPSKEIPDKDKNEEWHRKYILAVMGQTLGGGWYSLAQTVMNENYNIYNSMDAGDEFNFLQSSEDGQSLPAVWINYNTVRKRIHTMIGDLIKMGLDVDVEAINKEAITRKMDFKKKAFAKLRMKDVNAELMANSGMEMIDSGYVPESLEALESYMENTYKDNTSMIMKYILKYCIEHYKWVYKRIQAFRDVMVAGRCFAKTEVRNGFPNIRVIDPRNVVFDPYSTDDFLTDSGYWGEVRYMSFEDAAEQYDLSIDELNELYHNSSKDLTSLYWQGALSVSQGLQTFTPFEELNGAVRVLVFSGEWLDRKVVRYKVSEDKHGNKHYKTVDDKAKGKDIVEKVIATRREATLVGGSLLKEWGESKNITRDLDNPSVTRLSLVSLLPNYVNYRSVSKVDEMKGLQKLKDILLYKVQLEVSTAGRKGFAYDLSLKPENMPLEAVMRYLKTAGIAFYDSQREGMPASGNPFTQFDNSITPAISTYIELARYLDSQMDEVSGITPARSGEILGSSQAVAVTSSSLDQSNTVTAVYYKLFQDWESRLFQNLGDLAKITYPYNKEKLEPLLQAEGLDWLDIDSDVDLDDHMISIKSVPRINSDRQLFENTIQIAIQSQQLSPIDGLELLQDENTEHAIRKYRRMVTEREAQAAEMQAQQIQAQQQAAQAEKMADTQSQLAVTNAENQGELQRQQMKTSADLQKTQMKTQEAQRSQTSAAEKELLMKEIDRRSV